MEVNDGVTQSVKDTIDMAGVGFFFRLVMRVGN